jgi:hypothetical protein
MARAPCGCGDAAGVRRVFGTATVAGHKGPGYMGTFAVSEGVSVAAGALR